jgi:hypothetical protein
MTWSYDPTTDVGKVRLRISDTQVARPIMDNEDIEAFLSMAGDSIPLAAAMACEAIAMNELLCLKVVNLMGAVITDAASAAKQYRALAETLRAEAANPPVDADSPGFVSIEMADDFLQRREKYAKTVEEESY